MSAYMMKNKVEIPRIGYGTRGIPGGRETVQAVTEAIEAGYRHIDTASAYENESSVGKAVRDSGVDRSELFISGKLWNTGHGYENTLAAFEQTRQNLGLEYLDLYLIHWPAAKGKSCQWMKTNLDTWRAMETIYETGRVRAIGVSNFFSCHLRPLLRDADIKPMINQIEFHPGQMQEDQVKYCRDHEVLVSAWSPLGAGKMLRNCILQKIAAKYHISTAQLCIRWCLQNDVIPIVKTTDRNRMKENLESVNFAITEKDMEFINRMGYFGGSGLNPCRVEF